MRPSNCPQSIQLALFTTVTLGHILVFSSFSEEPDPASMQTPLNITVEVQAPDLYRIHMGPREEGEAEPQQPDALRHPDGATRLRLDAKSGELSVWQDESRIWFGSVEWIPEYGRAAVPGLHLHWEATHDEHLYGLGERFDRFDQHGHRVEMWIQDRPGMAGGVSYFCTPVLFSSRGYALYATDNPEGEFDLNADGSGRHHYRRAGESMTFYLAFSRSLKDLVQQRVARQGPLRGIPDWAWGPWISRNSYEEQSEAEAAIQGMIERDLPVAAIVQEAWKGTSETGEFNRFSPQRWPDLDAYFALCREHDIRTVLWQVPIIHPASPFYAEGVEKGYFVKKEDGSVSHRKEWLAGFANIDFTHPEGTAWFKDQMRDAVRLGVYGFKADDGEDIKPLDVFHDGRRGWEMHNEYAALYNLAMLEVFDEEGIDGILWARSGSLGIEQAPALWAGDQYATWEQMRVLIPAGLSSGLSGMPFWGHDIGGYIGDPGPELYMRWLQLGTFSPLMQYHGIEPREPWTFGAEALAAYRRLSHLRMNLRPTLISMGQETVRTGLPIMRPMTMEFPNDPRFGAEETQYMLGADLLVAPVLEPGVTGRTVLFPEGVWQHLLDPVAYEGPGEAEVPIPFDGAPVFVRSGARLPVELDENASLGNWRRGAPLAELAFDAGRPILNNPALPLKPSLHKRYALFTAGVREDQVERLFFTVTWEAQPDVEHPVEAEWQDGRVTVRIPPPSPDMTTSHAQTFRIRRNDAEGEILWQAELRWQPPFAMQAERGWPRVLAGNESALITTLTNQSRDDLPVRLILTPGAGADGEPEERTATIGAKAQEVWTWPITAAPGTDLAAVSFHVALKKHDLLLAEAHLAMARPLTWAVAGPFLAEPHAAYALSTPAEWTFSPEALFAAEPRPVRWEHVPQEHVIEHSGLDFIALFGPHTHASVYAMTHIESDTEQEIEIRAGSDDTLTLWLNGEQVFDKEVYRDADWDQEVIPARLRKGTNRLIAKVAQAEFGWRLHLHLTGPNGEPLRGVRDAFDTIADFDAARPLSGDARAHPGPLDWRIAGPFPFHEPDSFSKAGPLDALAERDMPLDQAADIRWYSVAPDRAPGQPIDLTELLGPAEFAFAYAVSEVAAEEGTTAEVICGSDDGIRLWLNGTLVLDADRMRPFAPGQDRVRVHLRPGRNRLVARISQAEAAWMFHVELLDLATTPPRPLGSRTEREAGTR